VLVGATRRTNFGVEGAKDASCSLTLLARLCLPVKGTPYSERARDGSRYSPDVKDEELEAGLRLLGRARAERAAARRRYFRPLHVWKLRINSRSRQAWPV
jgi:hypothetical protein